jgi:predicted RNase H-like HicB family nuclease
MAEVAVHRKVLEATQRPRGTRKKSEAPAQRDAIHAIVTRDHDTCVVACQEIAVITQGATLDQALANLRQAVALHLEGEDLKALGLASVKRIHVAYDLPAASSAV